MQRPLYLPAFSVWRCHALVLFVARPSTSDNIMCSSPDFFNCASAGFAVSALGPGSSTPEVTKLTFGFHLISSPEIPGRNFQVKNCVLQWFWRFRPDPIPKICWTWANPPLNLTCRHWQSPLAGFTSHDVNVYHRLYDHIHRISS